MNEQQKKNHLFKGLGTYVPLNKDSRNQSLFAFFLPNWSNGFFQRNVHVGVLGNVYNQIVKFVK